MKPNEIGKGFSMTIDGERPIDTAPTPSSADFMPGTETFRHVSVRLLADPQKFINRHERRKAAAMALRA